MSGMINGTQELHGLLNAEGNLNGNMAVRQGVDGVSPTINVMDITGEHHISITDVNGSKTTIIYDGKDGKDYILTEEDKNDIADLIISEKAPAITETASGETITITDSSNAPLQSMNVFGKSWQKTVGGNQLLNAKSLIIANNNNYIFSNVKYSSEGVIPITGGQSYVLSMAKCLTDKGINVFDASNNKLSCTTKNTTVGEGITMSFTAPENAVSMSFYAKITTDGTTSVDLAKPMLNKGTSALPWEEYTGGIASPNPNYPQDIHSNGESGSIEYGVYGKNLSTTDKATTLATGYLNATTGRYGYTRKGFTYTISFYCPTNSTGNLTLRAFDGTNMLGNHVMRNLVPNTRMSLTFTSQYDAYLVFAFNDSNYLSADVLTEVQLELGSIATDYEPYKEPQPLTLQTPNGLNGLKVTNESEANYKDKDGNLWACDYVDFERGKYVQRIAEVVLDGSDNYGYTSGDLWIVLTSTLFGHEVLHHPTNKYKQALQEYIMSNFFQFQNYTFTCSDDFSADKMYFRQRGEVGQIAMNTNLLETKDANGFKKFFSEHPTIIMAILETPIETDLTEEEIARYKATHTNYPNTTIINDANAYTEVGYVADTKLYIDNKFKELTSAMAQLL